jgi:acetylornithine deacetylase/succinyl-diaminopimelate desuccinylase-like protein
MKDGIDDIFAHIAANEQSFIQRVMDYVRHPSISAQNIGIAEVATLLVGTLSDLGFAAEAVPTDGHPMVLGRWDKAPGAPTILLYGHYDVQPPEPLDAWISPPFEPAIRDGRIYARGIGDNKGQHFAQFLAIESHLKVRGTLPCNVVVLLEGEEEVGSPHIASFIAANRDRLKADFVVIADGQIHHSGRPTISYGVRGVAGFELRVRHASRDVHSGNFGGIVPNPIWTLVHLLATMKNADGEITIDDFYDDFVPPTGPDRAAAIQVPFDPEEIKASLGLTRFDAPAARGLADRLMFHPTLTINGFHGGYGGPGKKTVLPNEAFVKCDIRLVENQTPQDVLAKVEAHVKRRAPEVEFISYGGHMPSKTPITSPYGEAIRHAIVTAQGVEPLLYPRMGGSLPNYVFTKILGIPSFVVPYANADQANHAPNENLTIECFLKGIRTGAALLTEIGGR